MARRALVATALAAVLMTFGVVNFAQFPTPRSPARAVERSLGMKTYAQDLGADPQQLPDVGATVNAFARAALALVAALAVALVPLDGAEAARSGGRMGGSAPRGGPPPSRSAPSARGAVGASVGGPNISIGVGPMIAPPVFSPFGGFGFGGFGLFGPPVLPLPIPSGPSGTDLRLQEQQRQDERMIDQQKREIDDLQRQIEQLKAQKK